MVPTTHIVKMLLSMLADDNLAARMQAVARIEQCRDTNRANLTRAASEKPVREFRVPAISGAERSLQDLLSASSVITEPPLTVSMSLDELQQSAQAGPMNWGYPCHTQNIERIIRSVSEAAVSVSGAERRDGMVRQQLQSRADMPAFLSKKDFRQ